MGNIDISGIGGGGLGAFGTSQAEEQLNSFFRLVDSYLEASNKITDTFVQQLAEMEKELAKLSTVLDEKKLTEIRSNIGRLSSKVNSLIENLEKSGLKNTEFGQKVYAKLLVLRQQIDDEMRRQGAVGQGGGAAPLSPGTY
ncbi:MAG: hypothetical protein KKC80_07235 [Candidatus Margulisbacteria bacterium]|nr:hypothetical protein [Candidatus Margulisiibacteriota bacterium]MBU1616966.1 hypothetical protein [Candidatus Margulisiibacteriota bacterium]MBU1867810.1 hypothetical protein [Candidatus Margulisiibacteriota bacterium]